MDKKTRIFFIVFFLLIAASVGATYYRIMVKRDYVIESQVDCDPETEKCFVWQCDPNATEEGEKCTGDPEEDVWYYKIARRNAGRIPLCDPEKDENCQPFVCEEGEKDCEEILCDEETAAEQEATCNDPEEYLKNNPPEEDEEDGVSADEEEAVCEEGDGSCAEAEPEEDADAAEDEQCADNEDGVCPAEEDESETGADNSGGPAMFPL